MIKRHGVRASGEGSSLRPLVLLSGFCGVVLTLLVGDLAAAGPKIQFAQEAYDFGKIPAGEIINHIFTFTNTGDQLLEINDVRPSCGCTAAGSWEHKVEPGKSATIPIRFNSTEYTGDIHKTVIVVSNDPSETNLVLHIRGTIWRPIAVTPDNAVFLANTETQTNETKVVHIVNNLDEALTLSEPLCTNTAFQASVKAIRPGKEFELVISLVPQAKAMTVSAPVRLHTSTTNMPWLTVMARAVIQPAMTSMPAAIVLPGHPLTDRLEYSVTVRYNGAGPLHLSEPCVAASPSSGIELADSRSAATPFDVVADTSATVREVQDGRMFILKATFPAGFRVGPSRSVALRVKTNHPNFPVLDIPVLQGQSLIGSLSDSETRLTGQDHQ